MFSSFFYLLRARGLDVSLNEWLTLMKALEMGLCNASFSGFYDLCRAVLVKSEADYDKFDGVFLEYFKDVKPTGDELPEELLKWLEKPKHIKGPPDMERAERNALLSNDRIREMFRERLEEQKSEHNGGSYWIGTHGVSVFGNDGYSPKGIRVGGESRYRRAIEVAGERKYRDFREDKALDMRRFQVALRGLRQYSSQIHAPKTELDMDQSIRKTGDNAGRLELVFMRPRKNTVKLLLLMDSGGSMEYYSDLCTNLFQAVRASNHFKDLKIYYFHNCIKRNLYTTPGIHYDERIDTQWVLQNLDSDYKVLIIGDAMMDPDELVREYHVEDDSMPASGLQWLNRLKEKFPRVVWVNPENLPYWEDKYWGQSIKIVRNAVDMYQLTVEGLITAFRRLLVTK